MSKINKSILILVVLLVLPIVIYYFSPGTILSLSRTIDRSKAQLEEKSVQVDDHKIVYLEGGKGETVFLLHGFGGDKDNWTKFSRSLTPSYHVVIPDIPGFGESTQDMNAVYDIDTQVSRLKKFADALGLKKFHVAGNSMGGSIAGAFSLSHADMVLSLALVNSSGVKSKNKSDFQKMLETGKNPLIVNSAEDYDKMLKMIFVNQPRIPFPVKRYLAAESVKRKPFKEKIMKDRRNVFSHLEPKLGKLEMPVLIIWGDSDRIIDVSCVDVLAAGIKNNTVAIMKDCGHVPMMERPAECADIYLKFLNKRDN